MALTPKELVMIRAIAKREGTADELAKRFRMSTIELRTFTVDNMAAIKATADAQADAPALGEVTPEQLSDLWITNKFERLKRYQLLAEELYNDALFSGLSGADLATSVREFRSYLQLAANELGQLLHRGSGESGTDDSLSVEIIGVDMETLR